MSIIKHATLQKIVAHDFRYDPRSNVVGSGTDHPTPESAGDKTVCSYTYVSPYFFYFTFDMVSPCASNSGRSGSIPDH